jgi:mRNA interferase MazF
MKQGELWFANLNPIKGQEQSGIRPVVIISGNLLNTHLNIVICCPLTTKIKNYKGNVVIEPSSKNKLKQISEILTFHIRSISKERLTKKIGDITTDAVNKIKLTLNEIMDY